LQTQTVLSGLLVPLSFAFKSEFRCEENRYWKAIPRHYCIKISPLNFIVLQWENFKWGEWNLKIFYPSLILKSWNMKIYISAKIGISHTIWRCSHT
jgi:hypothetical protein